MKKQFGILGVCLLFMTFWFSGCDEIGTKPDHITVNIMAAVFVKLIDANDNVLNISVDGAPVNIEMTKEGIDRLTFERVMQSGLCQATGSFDLSKDQYLECTATVPKGYQGYSAVAPGYAKLTWETVNASTNFGGMYNWYPKFVIHLKNGLVI
ncbi:MAG TPA: hypothetical protein DSN98_06835 [Thermoplasmata archaeon]|jgi:hypothetical protein|nr:MAG TPA: hypothetical protein DSN98_06835 [Thermoplasmata archaeon]